MRSRKVTTATTTPSRLRSETNLTYNVVILKSARYEYESIVGYLAQILKNPRAAGNFVAEFEYQLDLLREQPLLRPLSHIRELAARNYRSFPVNNYVCLYKFERETIYIAHVYHQSQDYARLV